jgi:hypothetical protein
MLILGVVATTLYYGHVPIIISNEHIELSPNSILSTDELPTFLEVFTSLWSFDMSDPIKIDEEILSSHIDEVFSS